MKQNEKQNLKTTRQDQPVVSVRYSDWKDTLKDFRSHEQSDCHNIHEHLVPHCGNIKRSGQK